MSSPDINRTIHPDDPMYAFSPRLYFEAEPQAVRCISLALEAAEMDEPQSILDFGCGYGRVLRFFKQAFPSASLTACDVRPDRIQFCAENFGAKPVLSTAEPEDLDLDFHDVVWSGSCLTHISKERWPGFLSLWKRSGRSVIFTTYGNTVVQGLRDETDLFQSLDEARRMVREYDETGYAFGEGKAVGGGDALTSREWVSDRLEEVGLELQHYLEAAWLGQDVVICGA